MTNTPRSSRRLALTVWGGCLLLASLKAWLISQASLFGDEAFYWWESHHLALAYSDVAPLTPFWVFLGDRLFDDPVWGVRGLFWLAGSLLPLAVFWTARSLGSTRDALLATGALCLMPLPAAMGLLAVPDVPLLLWHTLALGFALRCLQTPRPGYWLALGLCLALGFLTHYRFALTAAALSLFWLTHRPARHQLATPGPWLAAALGLAGTLPLLWFNVSHQFAAADFHFLERHPFRFQAEGLLFPLRQALALSPVWFLLLLWAGWLAWRPERPATHRLLGLTGLFIAGTFAILGPWADQRSTNTHWPLSAWFTLVLLVPVTLRDIAARHGRAWAAFLGCLALGLGGLSNGLGAAWFWQATHPKPAPYAYQRYLTDKFVGWPALADRVTRHTTGPVITGHYYDAAQLAFETGNPDRFQTLDNDKLRRDGRWTQLRLWDRWRDTATPEAWPDSAWLLLRRGESDRLHAQRQRLCAIYPDLRLVERFSLSHGIRRYWLLQGSTQGAPAHNPLCDPPINGWVDVFPKADTKTTHRFRVAGWATHPDGIRSIALQVGSHAPQSLPYGLIREDLGQDSRARRDPAFPRLGFDTAIRVPSRVCGWQPVHLRLVTQRGYTERWLEQYLYFPCEAAP